MNYSLNLRMNILEEAPPILPGRGTGILNNELYIGRLVWNRLRYVKDLDTGKRVSRPNASSEWVTTAVPELRIVEYELWNQVKARQVEMRRASSRLASRPFSAPRQPLPLHDSRITASPRPIGADEPRIRRLILRSIAPPAPCAADARTAGRDEARRMPRNARRWAARSNVRRTHVQTR